MKKNWFNKLLLSYLPILFMISLSLLLITYLTLSEMSKRSAMKANDFLAQNIMQSIDDALHVIDESLFLNIIQNERVSTFFEPLPRQQRLYTDYQTINIFRELLKGNPFIDSIYLYRLSDQMVLTPTAFIEIEKFGDKEYIGRAIGTLKPFEWEGTREYREHPYEAGRGVISLAKFVQLSTRSLVVVNVRTDSLSELIQRMSPSPINFIELVNGDGHVIASNYLTNRKLGELAEEMERNPDQGEVMSKVTSEYSGWTVRSGVYKNGIAEWVSSLFYVWIAFGFLIIAVGVFWLIHVTRRNYRPIQTITERIADYSKQKKQVVQGDKGIDEFNYIARAIEDLMDTSNILQDENNKHRVYRKKQIFLNLLEGGLNDNDSSWRDEMELFGMDVTVHTLIVAIIEIDRYVEFADRYNYRDQQLLKSALSGANREIADNEFIQSWSEWLNRRQLAVIYMLESPEISVDQIVRLCEKLRLWVEQNLPYTITIGVGNDQDDIEKVQESYTCAMNALQYKASLGMNRLIEQEDLISMPQGEMFKQLQNIRAICQSFRSGEEDWRDHYQELYWTVKGQMYSIDDLHSLLNYLVFHLHKEMMDLPQEFQSIWNGDIHNQLKEVVDQKETVDESCEEFQRVMQDAFEQMRQLRQSKNNHQLIQKVKWFVSDNYANPDMSLTRLSDEFGLKSGYLSRLFKEEFGVNFSDYLARERINASLLLLAEAADMTVQDIAAAVGYTNTLTFIRTFKKMTGNTPGSYRKELM